MWRMRNHEFQLGKQRERRQSIGMGIAPSVCRNSFSRILAFQFSFPILSSILPSLN